MHNYIKGMKNYATVKGRTTRAEFWQYSLVTFALIMVAAVISGFGEELNSGLGGQPAKSVYSLVNLVILIHVIPSLVIVARRAHDANISTLWAVIGVFIPLASLVIGCLPSFAGTNKYGPPVNVVSKVEADISGHSSSSTVEGLEKIAALKASGIIDDNEFALMKRKLLGS